MDKNVNITMAGTEPPRTHLAEAELNTERTEVKTVLVRAFCPHCGREIKTKPPYYNPSNLKMVCMYDCECGLRSELDNAYPRVVFVDNENNEYDAYTK